MTESTPSHAQPDESYAVGSYYSPHFPNLAIAEARHRHVYDAAHSTYLRHVRHKSQYNNLAPDAQSQAPRPLDYLDSHAPRPAQDCSHCPMFSHKVFADL